MTWKITRRFNRQSVSLTAAIGLLAQAGRPLISLLTLPLLLAHLGQSGLGVWLIALSLMSLASTVNSGLSISLVTFIGRCSVDPSDSNLQRLTTSATLIAALTAVAALLVILPATLLLDWTTLLNLGSSPSGEQVKWLMFVLGAMLGFGFITMVPRQIMLGRMHGYIAHLLDFGGLVMGAFGLILGLLYDAPLWMLALAFMGPALAIMMGGGIIYLRLSGISFFTSRNLHRKTFFHLGQDALRMVSYHTSYSISSHSDLLLIGIILGAPASAAYGVALRIFSLPIQLVTTVNNAQWPALARADASGEHAIVVRILWLTLLIGSGGATAMALIAAFFYQPLIEFWLGQPLKIEPAILIGMVAWVLVATIVSTYDSILRARNETLLLMRSMMVMAVLNITVTLLLLPRIGAAGAIWGSVTGYLLALLLPYSLRLWQGPGMPGFRKGNNGETNAG